MKQNIIRITTGLIIIAIGVGAFLGALNFIPFWDTFAIWWPALLVIGGLMALISDLRTNYLWGGVVSVVGALLLLKAHNLVDFNVFSLVLPIIIIAVGLSIIISSNTKRTASTRSVDLDEISAIFSGSETSNRSQNYQGGNVVAVFGGVSLDLTDAKIKDEAQLNIFALCGGVELKVPKDWRVISKVAPILGGVENKSRGVEKDSGPVLILTGTAALGGVEVKV